MQSEFVRSKVLRRPVYISLDPVAIAHTIFEDQSFFFSIPIELCVDGCASSAAMKDKTRARRIGDKFCGNYKNSIFDSYKNLLY
jgi:hypothetical protein